MDFESFRELVKSNRSYRRFDHSKAITVSQLEKLVELTRYCASGRNLQPLKYRVVAAGEYVDALYPNLKWAGYYQDWDGPSPDERPAAYIVQCLDTSLTLDPMCDEGLQLEAITLGAAAMGIHGVIIKSFNPEAVSHLLGLPGKCKPVYVLALGYPAEEIEIIDTDGTSGADIKYFRDSQGRHIVPKRPLSELLI